MEEAEEQEAERRHEEARVEEERMAAEAEEVRKAKAGKNRRPWSLWMKMGWWCWRGSLKASHVTCAERQRSCAFGQTSMSFLLMSSI